MVIIVFQYDLIFNNNQHCPDRFLHRRRPVIFSATVHKFADVLLTR